MPLTEVEQHLRAAEWVRAAPVPDLAALIRVPPGSGPIRGADDWIVLRCFVIGRERDSQTDSVLRIAGFFVPHEYANHLGLDRTEYRKIHPHAQDGFHDFREGVRGSDPFEAVWAPWAIREHGTEPISTDVGGGSYDAVAASAGLTWEAEDGERSLWLPARWMRQSLGIVDADRLRHFTRREPGDRWHDEWHYRDRAGEVHAVYVYSVRGSDQEQALIIKRSSLRRALRGSRMCLAWEGWLYRALNIWLRPGPREQEPWDVERDWTWVALTTGKAVTVTHLPGWGACRRYDEPLAPEPSVQDGTAAAG